MNFLAFDTSTEVLSIGVAAGAQTLLHTGAGGAQASSGLISGVQSLLAQAQTPMAALDAVVFGAGPGSFTGIRIGIAAARAIGLVRNIPVIGVPTLIAFAAPFIGKGEAAVAALIDARHGQVYAQVFSAIGKCIVEPRILPMAAAIRLIGSGPVFLTGNAAQVAAIEAWSSGLKAEVAGETGAPEISYIARLGALAEPSASPPVPMYLAETSYKRVQPSRLTAQTYSP